jgi:D-alanyl-D-alanine dipeptidase
MRLCSVWVSIAAISLWLAVLLVVAPRAVSSDTPDFVDTTTIVPNLVVEMRYFTYHNFIGRPITGYEAGKCLLTKEAAWALRDVAVHMQRLTPPLTLKVYDCYRPQMAVDDFVQWSLNDIDTLMKVCVRVVCSKSCIAC